MMSSITATPSTIRAKGVSMIPRSNMIREITGMLVTAIASPNTSRSAVSFWATPSRLEESMTRNSSRPATKGSTTPTTVTSPTTRVSPRRKTERISAPEANISSSRPIW